MFTHFLSLFLQLCGIIFRYRGKDGLLSEWSWDNWPSNYKSVRRPLSMAFLLCTRDRGSGRVRAPRCPSWRLKLIPVDGSTFSGGQYSSRRGVFPNEPLVTVHFAGWYSVLLPIYTAAFCQLRDSIQFSDLWPSDNGFTNIEQSLTVLAQLEKLGNEEAAGWE